MAKPQKTSPKAIKAAEMAVRALELRKAGATYETIAQMLGYASKSTAFTAVNRIMTQSKREASKEAFEMELRRLDDLMMTLWPIARAGENMGAIDRVLRIMERRAKLLGLDAPEKSQQQIQQVIRVQYEEVQFQPTEFEPDVDVPQLTTDAVPADDYTVQDDEESLDEDDMIELDMDEREE
jgi:hypothetical protein